MLAAPPLLDFAPPKTAPASGKERKWRHGDIFPIQRERCFPEDTIEARTQFIQFHARKLPRGTGFDSSTRLNDSIRYVTEIVFKRCQHVESTLECEVWSSGWTMPREGAIFLDISLKRPYSDLKQPLERFFANAKRSEATGVPGSEIIKTFIGDISTLQKQGRSGSP